MSQSTICAVALIAVLGVVCATAPAIAQTCGPLNNGRIADAFYEGTVIFWDPMVEYEKVVLTIKGPCEDIVKEFGPKDQISFDIREIERITDGQYTWELSRVANVDPEVQERLQESRGTGEEDDLWWNFFQKGLIPDGPYRDSASFSVVRGEIVDPNEGSEEKSAVASKGSGGASGAAGASIAAALPSGEGSGGSAGNDLATKAVVLTNGDGVIRNSLCVGFDCPNNPTFSDSTIILTENNTRIKFDDTSTINAFPRNDWEIEANSNLNGGASYLGFNDCGQSSGGGCATDLVFAVEAGARQNALYVESDGDVGFGTENPVVRLHTIDGDTPGLRLEQDGSSGFQPQTWDVAGNETNFFVRDATNGSTLPFRIRPGAPSSSIFIDQPDGDVGLGTSSPEASLHVNRSTGSSVTAMKLSNNDIVQFEMENTADSSGIGDDRWSFQYANDGDFRINKQGSGALEFELQADGDLIISGTYTPDYVFEPDYPLLPLDELKSFIQENGHLPNVPSDAEVKRTRRINLSQFQMRLLEKIEELTLYTLDQHEGLEELRSENEYLKERIAALEEGRGAGKATR